MGISFWPGLYNIKGAMSLGAPSPYISVRISFFSKQKKTNMCTVSVVPGKKKARESMIDSI